MSFDLYVYHTTQRQTDEEAIEAYCKYMKCGNAAPYIEPSPKITKFFSELTALFPVLEDLKDLGSDDSPWNISPIASDSDVSIALRSSVSSEDLDTIVSLVEKHGLVCLDLQSFDIVCAPQGIRIGDIV